MHTKGETLITKKKSFACPVILSIVHVEHMNFRSKCQRSNSVRFIQYECFLRRNEYIYLILPLEAQPIGKLRHCPTGFGSQERPPTKCYLRMVEDSLPRRSPPVPSACNLDRLICKDSAIQTIYLPKSDVVGINQ